MAILLMAQAEFEASSGITADAAVNTFWFFTTANSIDTEATVADIAARLEAFYTTPPDGETVATQRYMSADSLGNTVGHTVTVYVVQPGPPTTMTAIGQVELGVTGYTGGVAGPLPWECSIVVSTLGSQNFADPVSLPRRRGRFYVPFLNDDCLGSDGFVASSVCDVMSKAAAQYLVADGWDGDQVAEDYPVWGVWSRAGARFSPIYQTKVNNEFDTQRRRGRDATFASVQPAGPPYYAG